MPEHYRITYRNRLQNRMWRYVFYAEGNLTTVMAAADSNAMKQAICAFHAEPVFLENVSVANVNGRRRDWDKRRIHRSGAVKVTLGANADRPDLVETSIMYRFRAVTGESRNITISGIPDAAVEPSLDGSIILGNDYRDNYIDALTTAAKDAGFMIQTKLAVEPGDKKAVTRIAAEPDTERTYTRLTMFTNDNNFDTDDRVEFEKDNNNLLLLPYNGVHRVIEATPYAAGPPVVRPTLLINAQYAGPDDGYGPGRMFVKLVDTDYLAIHSSTFVEVVSRQRGPADAPAGRESAVSYRQRR